MHLFLHCPFARTIWATQGIPPVDSYRGKEQGAQILAVLWAIWLNQNAVIFRVRTVCTDEVVHDVEGIMASWFPSSLGGS